jgi:hypothetical protein
MTSYQIAAVLNVSASAVQSRLRKLGIARTKSEAQRAYHLPKAALVDTGIRQMRSH